MREAGVPEPAIAVFDRLVAEVESGTTGEVPTASLEPVADVPRAEALPAARDAAALGQVAVIKLNGGLGTTMGLRHAKSLIEVRGGRSFLELIVAQLEALRASTGAALPLVLLDSFRTQEDTRAAIAGVAGVRSILQHREPRLRAEDLHPVRWPDDPALEWCPPGHGDVYLALLTSGALDELLEQGLTWAFLSNADNLGAVPDPAIAAWVVESGAPFVMEVVEGTEADRKGGHVARRDGRLLLRETAQTPKGEEASFRDFRRWRYYNSNNLWIDLRALRDRLGADPDLRLPLIVNRKRVAGGDTPEVLQLETAMGAALGVFDGAALLCVPRTRFAPVKTTNDLLVVRSDAYEVDDAARVLPVVGELPFVDLEPERFGKLPDFEARFPAGAPSLRECSRLVVHGDVTFGADVRVRGSVTIEATDGPLRVPAGARLDG